MPQDHQITCIIPYGDDSDRRIDSIDLRRSGCSSGLFGCDAQQHKRSEGKLRRLNPSSRRLILEWIDTARTAETRQKRLQETADKALRNQRANHHSR